MQNSKRSITLKVVLGYLLVTALAAVALWFIYSQVIAYNNLTRSHNSNNEKLFLVSEITTNLYETENISRRVIQSGLGTDLELYNSKIEDIRSNLSSLRKNYPDSAMQTGLDSISNLLSRKTNNLEELMKLREQDRNTSYYTQVINELKKVDESFEEQGYEERFSNLEPHQRQVLISLLQYAEEDNADVLTNRSADSLIGSVKNVLAEVEFTNQQFRNTINQKENELLDNDTVLNEQLRKLLASIEQKERLASLVRVETSQDMLKETSLIIITAGIVCVLVIIYFLISIVQDISKSQRYRTELEKAKNFAESLLKSKEQFMTTITHDLRSPLNTLIGYSDLLQKTAMDSRQAHYLNHLKKSSDYILRLVNDLLDFTKLEAGKMLIEQLPFNPKSLIEDTVYNALPIENDKDVEIKVEALEETDVQVLSDPFRIKQIIANLVTNAYKFTDKGEIKITASLQKEIEDSYRLIISVKDTGIGISKEKQEDIFEEFSQENTQTEKNYGGSGLGLAITKSLTQLLKGDIELVSEQGVGSEFIVKLPVVKLEKKQQKEVPAESGDNFLDLSGKKVLVVDDDSSQLALTQELMKSIKMESHTCMNGVDALEKLKSANFDLVLTDIQMPKMDGFELLKRIKSNPELAQIPVIALSGRTNIATETYIQTGFTRSLIKPYKSETLLETIAEIFKVRIPVNQKKSDEITESSCYNLEEILMFSGNDRQAMQIIIAAFLESSKVHAEALENAVRENNKEELGKIAHKMLPMLKQMKAVHLIQSLESLEAQKRIPKENVHKTVEDIRALMKSLRAEVID